MRASARSVATPRRPVESSSPPPPPSAPPPSLTLSARSEWFNHEVTKSTKRIPEIERRSSNLHQQKEMRGGRKIVWRPNDASCSSCSSCLRGQQLFIAPMSSAHAPPGRAEPDRG